MKSLILAGLCMCFLHGDAQIHIQAVIDTGDYHSYIIRNNLLGQQKLFSNDSGTMYRLAQDGMPCWSPKTITGGIPNGFFQRRNEQPHIQVRPWRPQNNNREKNNGGKNSE